MKVILAHNYYQQRGGEDRVFADEAALLESHGHRVVRFIKHNDSIRQMRKLSLARDAVWNRRYAKELHQLVQSERADVVHFHNTFPLISPAAYGASRSAGAAVVQTLHNYRFSCANAFFFRDNRICEDCLSRFVPWPAVLHACYRENRPASAVVATMLVSHRLLGTYRRCVDRYIALSQFSKRKLVSAGLPEEKMAVKPNFVAPDPGIGRGDGGYALYLGRLSAEKGIPLLVEAWQRHSPSIPLKVVGSGPFCDVVAAAAEQNSTVQWYPEVDHERIWGLMSAATCLVLPTRFYEGFPKVIVEAFAAGTPVITSDLGSAAELVEDGHTGFHFRTGDPHDLANRVEQLVACPDGSRRMRRNARVQYESNYTADRNYEMLLAIYRDAIRARHGESSQRNEAADCPPRRTPPDDFQGNSDEESEQSLPILRVR